MSLAQSVEAASIGRLSAQTLKPATRYQLERTKLPVAPLTRYGLPLGDSFALVAEFSRAQPVTQCARWLLGAALAAWAGTVCAAPPSTPQPTHPIPKLQPLPPPPALLAQPKFGPCYAIVIQNRGVAVDLAAKATSPTSVTLTWSGFPGTYEVSSSGPGAPFRGSATLGPATLARKPPSTMERFKQPAAPPLFPASLTHAQAAPGSQYSYTIIGTLADGRKACGQAVATTPVPGTPGQMQVLTGPGGGVVSAVPQVSGQRQLPSRPIPAPAPQARLCVELPSRAGQLPPKANRGYLKIAGDGSVVGVNRGPLASIPEKTWEPGQTLRVRFIDGSAALRARVRLYAEEWRPHANVRFDWVGDGVPAEIRVSFAQTDASWSQVGRDALLVPANEATMNFGWFKDETTDQEVRRTALHEFGHALGLIHEHQSPAAGIQWDRPKVYEWYSTNLGWDQATVDANVLTKLSANTTNYTVFDPTSIMQYHVPASLTLDGKGIGWNTELSRMDQAAIRAWYPFPTASVGQLRTGDDCDAINFVVKEGVVPQGQLLVRLGTSGPVNWWKSIKIPFGNGGLHEIDVGGLRAESRWTFWRNVLDESRPIRFSKAKFLGVHTELGFTWDVLRALPDGGELHLVWVRDSCSQ